MHCRLDVVNEFTFLIMGGRTHLAPLGSEHRRVLDLGTGSGIWAVDFAQENPETEVVGIDRRLVSTANITVWGAANLSRIQPSTAGVVCLQPHHQPPTERASYIRANPVIGHREIG